MTQIKVRRQEGHGTFAETTTIASDGERVSIDVFKPAPSEKGKFPYRWCVEVYKGANYVVGSSARSYSRMYPEGKGLPAKYRKTVSELKKRLGIR